MSGAPLAGPPGECCRQTVHHDGTPTGTLEVIGGATTYVARPKTRDVTKIILFFSDVYGALYTNSQLVMDYWAENGYLVLGLDYFEGDSKALLNLEDETFDYPGWIRKKQARAEVLVPPWIEAIKRTYEGWITEFADFGARGRQKASLFSTKANVYLWAGADYNFNTGAFAHPAFLTEADFEGVKRKTSAYVVRRAEDLLVAQNATYFIQAFSSVKHGFSTRGDPGVPAESA
ncbi:hypothetical protein C8Q79DRAFT_923105 [Trametes meyenii]|nr:hypothetical protein C8Q79DRAFT_923105 [Trametes meyenii]